MSLVSAKKICKQYNALDVLLDVSFDIAHGQKIALVGYNGTGKSTLLKILAGIENADSGSVDIASGKVVAYLPQEIILLPDELVIGLLNRTFGGDILLANLLHEAKIILTGLGIVNIAFDAKANTLSGGQKCKIVLAGLLLKDPHLLLLDEPTNNLDIPALIWLEKFLRKTDQACLIVSSDRYFIQKLNPSCLYQIIDGRLCLVNDFVEYIKNIEERVKIF